MKQSAIPDPDLAAQDTTSNDLIALFIASRGLRVLWVIMGLLGTAMVATNSILYFSMGIWNTPATIPIFLLLFMVAWLLLKRCLRQAFLILIWGLVAVCLYASSSTSGMQTPILLMLPLICMLGGWLLGVRQILLLLVFACTGVAFIAWQQTLGHIPAAFRSPGHWAVVLIAASSTGAFLGIALTRSAHEHYRNALTLADKLAVVNAHLEVKVEQRTAELSKALEDMQRMQDDLIQSEKLASLGSMVAGISHELNTPIGNAVTVASALMENVQRLDTDFQTGTIKRSALASGLGGLKEGIELIDRSVNRAAALVASFKQVAIDQTSERRRIFDLHDVVEDLVSSLRRGLKHQPWVLENGIPVGIVCDGFPGPLRQVLSNLIHNAVLHAFDGRDQGRVCVDAKLDAGWVELSVTDDGIGMNTTTLVRIFDPFFTTKLGRGGSGLGLSISNRIAATILAGELRAVSSPGAGSRFILTMPLHTPGKL